MSQKPSVLVVDDESGILDTLRILLRNEGFEVTTAQGGKAGLEQIKDFKTAASDPISFSSTFHGGLLSSPIFKVENGAFKKVQDPIKIER